MKAAKKGKGASETVVAVAVREIGGLDPMHFHLRARGVVPERPSDRIRLCRATCCVHR